MISYCRDSNPRLGDVFLKRAPFLKVNRKQLTKTVLISPSLSLSLPPSLSLSLSLYIQLYSPYISNFDRALKTLEEQSKKNPVFAQMTKEFEMEPKCNNLTVAAYLLETVQRIPRYKLLLAGRG